MSSSDLSSLSSLSSSDDDPPRKSLQLKQVPLSFAQKHESTPSSPEPPSRQPSPSHEFVLADNKDIAFIVMFRSRFAEAFPKNVPNLGPQDIERGIVDSQPSHQIENLLCALLGLVLNRKKNVDREHYGRALEEALLSQRYQWPPTWEGVNPIHAGKSFNTMDPVERLDLLRHLALWALNTSELITGIIKESYKQSRQESDLNQPLSVQPWGDDGRKRRYWLIEGQHDTPFRIYRESNPKLVNRTWWSVASTIEEAKEIADTLNLENSQAGRRLSSRILSAIPRLEATEERRKRKEYRLNRRAMFQRPSSGFSLYEGRTRGKRMKYTYSDDEDSTSDGASTRRSVRQSGFSTPGEPGVPTITASGRQVRSRFGRSYGEPIADSLDGNSSRASLERSYSHDTDDLDPNTGRYEREGRSSRPGARSRLAEQISGDESDDEDEPPSSAEEWDGDDNDVEGIYDDDDDDEENQASDADSEDSLLDEKMSLIIRLPYRKPVGPHSSLPESTAQATNIAGNISPIAEQCAEIGPTEQRENSPQIAQGVPKAPTTKSDLPATSLQVPQRSHDALAQQLRDQSIPTTHSHTPVHGHSPPRAQVYDLQASVMPPQPRTDDAVINVEPIRGLYIHNGNEDKSNAKPASQTLSNDIHLPTSIELARPYIHQLNGYPQTGVYAEQSNTTPQLQFLHSKPKFNGSPPQTKQAYPSPSAAQLG